MVAPTPEARAALLAEATDPELVSLVAGADNWHTAAVPRLRIPALRVSDGPNGVRGTAFGGVRSACFPCGEALAATWDLELASAVGREMAAEARAKGAAVVLAPTVNLARTPIGGRNFECYGEDPWLSARVAVAWISALQERGIAACVKHFAANDTEHERMTVSVEVDERTLREVYLRPFEAAVREARTRCVMSSYNRLDGIHAADHRWLLTEVLREQWGFDGLVMSDWFGLHSTTEGLRAGLDLEMPGPPIHRGARLAAALAAGEVDRAQVATAAGRVLDLAAWCGWPEPPGPETARNDPGTRTVLRTVAARSMVLCRNDGTLPIDPATLRTVAVVGPLAAAGAIHGGGSAQVRAEHRVGPLAGLQRALEAHGVDVVHEPACTIHEMLPAVPGAGFTAAWVDRDGRPAGEQVLRRAALLASDRPRDGSVLTISGPIELPAGASTFSLLGTGATRLWIDDALVIDNTDWTLGRAWFGYGSTEARATLDHPGGPASLRAELRPAIGPGVTALHVGWLAPEPANAFDRAVAAARSAAVAVVVVGTTHEWETEGHDRDSMDLPGRQDELVRAVAAANPRTIVVVNAGSPVTMDWADDVAAVVQAFFPGQEFGDALADVLCGVVDASGRLPVTVPHRLSDTPAYLDHPGPGGVLRYSEGVFVGHRWYAARSIPVRFAFGHGLSYTSFSWNEFSATTTEATITVTNTGSRAGREVVQVYITPPHRWQARVLAGFVAVDLAPGASSAVTVRLDDRAMQTWRDGDWVRVPGSYRIEACRSAVDIVATVDVVATVDTVVATEP
ncbi:MAG: beta-glucosidase [Acidimicrobiales bacterium]